MKRKTLKKIRAKRYKIPDKSIKITAEGQECRHCDGKVIRKRHKAGWKPKAQQPYYFEFWFKCVNCRAIYTLEAAKRYVAEVGNVETRQAFEYALSKGNL